MRLYTCWAAITHPALCRQRSGADDVAGLEAAADLLCSRALADGRLPGRCTGRGRAVRLP